MIYWILRVDFAKAEAECEEKSSELLKSGRRRDIVASNIAKSNFAMMKTKGISS